MNPMRKRMASFLIEEARRGIKLLDSNSTCREAMRKIDIDNILTKDINKICEAVYLIEITRILSLSKHLRNAAGKDKEKIKQNLKSIVESVVARVEKESGKLEIPESCRELLLNLYVLLGKLRRIEV